MLGAPSARLAARHGRAWSECAARGLDAFVVSTPHNIAYLSNFDGSTALLVVTASRLYLLSDFRYSAAVARLFASPSAPPNAEFVLVEGSYDGALAGVLNGLAASSVGFEAHTLSVARASTWATKLGASFEPEASRRLVAVEQAVERLRTVKDDDEVAVLREAARRLSTVAVESLSSGVVAAGRAECDIAAEIDYRMKRAGFERPAFDTIVATGANSALPHAHPTDAVVSPGDLVVVDFGGVYQGYCVDLTRTVGAGAVGGEARRIYRAVVEAHRRAVAAVGAGVSTTAVDAAARDHLTSCGLGQTFGHGTGHGLGLEVHEEPRVGKRRDDAPAAVLEAGMVITIEPGAYIDGFGGVRIEDDVLVLAGGGELLTAVPLDAGLMDG